VITSDYDAVREPVTQPRPARNHQRPSRGLLAEDPAAPTGSGGGSLLVSIVRAQVVQNFLKGAGATAAPSMGQSPGGNTPGGD
jgi:hypothetical protein